MSILGKRSKPDASISYFHQTAIELESGKGVFPAHCMKFTSMIDLMDMSFCLKNHENGTEIYFYPEHDDIEYNHYYKNKNQNQNQSRHHGKVYTRHYEGDHLNFIGNMWSVLKESDGIRYFAFEYKNKVYSSEKIISTESSIDPDGKYQKYQNVFYALRYLVENVLSNS